MINAANISFASKAAALCGLTLVAGCADMERGFSDRDMDRFVAAMIAVDCKVHEQTAPKVEQKTGFSDEKLRAISSYLLEKKRMTKTLQPAGMILINEGCP